MKRQTLTLLLIAGIGCSGSGSKEFQDNGSDTNDASITQEVGEDIPDNNIADDIAADVVDEVTGDIPGDVVDASAEDGAVCEHLHYFGDGLYGENCWDPPENLCKDGDDLATSWYCKSDGSLCCLTPSSGCFHCGWIECGPEMNRLTDECGKIDIPERFVTCAADIGQCSVNSPDVYAEMKQGECEITLDANYQVCWDDHIL